MRLRMMMTLKALRQLFSSYIIFFSALNKMKINLMSKWTRRLISEVIAQNRRVFSTQLVQKQKTKLFTVQTLILQRNLKNKNKDSILM